MDKMYIKLNKNKLSDYNIAFSEAEKYINNLFAQYNITPNIDGWYDNGSFESIIQKFLRDFKSSGFVEVYT